MALKKRPIVGVRKFRETFQTIDEPVEVVKVDGTIERIGVWIPEKKTKRSDTQWPTSGTPTSRSPEDQTGSL